MSTLALTLEHRGGSQADRVRVAKRTTLALVAENEGRWSISQLLSEVCDSLGHCSMAVANQCFWALLGERRLTVDAAQHVCLPRA